MWDDVLRDPQVPGETRLHVRFQDGGEGSDCEGESGGEGGETGEDLRRSPPLVDDDVDRTVDGSKLGELGVDLMFGSVQVDGSELFFLFLF